MPHTKSAAKRHRKSETARVKHKSRRTEIKTEEKKYRDLLSSGDLAACRTMLSRICSMLDKSVKIGTIHKGKADRKKSQLSKLFAVKEKSGK